MTKGYIVIKNRDRDEHGPFYWLVQEDMACGDVIAGFDEREHADLFVAALHMQRIERVIRHNMTEHGGEVTEAVSKVIILTDDEIRVEMVGGRIMSASGCSRSKMGEVLKAWPDAEDLREESPDDPKENARLAAR